MREAVDDVARDIGVAIDPIRIHLPIEHGPHFRESRVEISLLRSGKFRIRHCPFRDEAAEEKPFGEAELFPGASEEQLFRLLHFLLPLNFRVRFSHTI